MPSLTVRRFAAAAGAVTAVALLVLEARAFYRYTGSTPNCATCHGDYRAPSYVSLKDGRSWGASLHDVHRDVMIGGDCSACHFGGLYDPVYLGKSAGGAGLAALSCSGCHGRRLDGWGRGTMGYSAGLRLRHWRADRTINGVSTRYCRHCHPDSDPNTTPASEWILPPYEADPGEGHPEIPTDPCNLPPGLGEDVAGGPAGLDNDGDGLLDADDPDCAPGPPRPGEASGRDGAPLEVSGFNPLTGEITITYAPACEASTHHIYFGPLAAIASYGWTGQVCDLGAWGTATFNPGPGSYFFVVVASREGEDGSYGRGMRVNRSMYERPPFAGSACGTVQNMSHRCD